jgi:hypothetical protein
MDILNQVRLVCQRTQRHAITWTVFLYILLSGLENPAYHPPWRLDRRLGHGNVSFMRYLMYIYNIYIYIYA